MVPQFVMSEQFRQLRDPKYRDEMVHHRQSLQRDLKQMSLLHRAMQHRAAADQKHDLKMLSRPQQLDAIQQKPFLQHLPLRAVQQFRHLLSGTETLPEIYPNQLVQAWRQ